MTILSSSSRMRSAETMESRPCMRSHRGRQRRVGLEREAGREAGGAQHAQRVVAEGDLRVERRAQPSGRQVAQPVEGVDQLHVGQAQRQGVDGEVAPRQVDDDVVAEGHLGLARLGHVDLGPVRRDLVDLRCPCGSRWCRSARPASRRRRPSPAPAARSRRAGRRSSGRGRRRPPAAPGNRASRTEPPTKIQRLPGRGEAARQLLGGARRRGGTVREPTWTAPAHGSAPSSLSLCRRAGPGPPSARSRWPPQPSSARSGAGAAAAPCRARRAGGPAPHPGLADAVGHAHPALVQPRARRRVRRRGRGQQLHVSLTFYGRIDDASQLATGDRSARRRTTALLRALRRPRRRPGRAA